MQFIMACRQKKKKKSNAQIQNQRWGEKQGRARNQNHRKQPPNQNCQGYKNLKGQLYEHEREDMNADDGTAAAATRFMNVKL